MNTAELILEYFKLLFYPVVVLIIYFSLHSQIKSLLAGVSYLLGGKIVAKYGDLSIEIGRSTEVEDQRKIYNYLISKDGILQIGELYKNMEEQLGIVQFKKEKRRIQAATESLIRQGVLVKDDENNLHISPPFGQMQMSSSNTR